MRGRGRPPAFVVKANRPASPGLRRDDYGPNWRKITAEVRARDGNCCQHPGCTCTTGLEVHHIIPLSEGGLTKKWNLITLCQLHHNYRHRLRQAMQARHR